MFSIPLRVAGYLLLAIGLVVGVTGGWGIAFAVLLVGVGGFFSFTKSGVLIDAEDKSVKQYTQIMGFKKGDFKEASNYPFICIIEKKMPGSRNQKDSKKHEIYLLSKSHRRKVLLGMYKDEAKANQEVRKLASVFSSEVVDYVSPVRV